MRSHDEYRSILELWERGIPKKRISIMIGIPRATVRDCITKFGTVSALDDAIIETLDEEVNRKLQRICDPHEIETQRAYAYLLGIYLGDGSIGKNRKIYRLRVTLDAKYPNIITGCAQAISVILPENHVGYVNHYWKGKVSCIDVSSFYKHWPTLLPQHGANHKHEREIKLADWQQKIVEAYPLEMFRGLYHSDGSRFSNIVNGKDYPRYQFSNCSPDINRIFRQTCDQLGLECSIATRGRLAANGAVHQNTFISKWKDVEYLDSVIGPKS
jgi:hypothetical protein